MPFFIIIDDSFSDHLFFETFSVVLSKLRINIAGNMYAAFNEFRVHPEIFAPLKEQIVTVQLNQVKLCISYFSA